MGCGKSHHQLITPDASQSSNVIQFSTNKLSAVVTPLPPNHSSSTSTHHPTISSTSYPPPPSAQPDETGLIYSEKQSNDQNLVALCKKGKLEMIQKLLTSDSRGVAINMKGMWGNTPLIVACQYHHPEVALYLLQYSSIDILHMNDHGVTALLYACLEGLDHVVQKLLAMGCNPNTKPAVVYNSQTDRSDQLTPLIAAIVNGHLEILKSLISVECDLNIKISQKSDQVAIVDGKKMKLEVHEMTPLMVASKYQQKEIFRYLLTEGGAFNCLLQDSEGFSVLHYLCRAKKPNTTPTAAGGETASDPSTRPLPVALEMLNLFIEAIPDSSSLLDLLYLPDKKGSLPIHVASESTFLELVECLLKTEKNLLDVRTFDRNLSSPHQPTHQVHAMNAMGYTPLHISIKKRCTEVVKLLLEYDSDPYQPLVVNPHLHQQRLSQNNTEKCAHDAAMKLRQTTEIYQLLSSFHEKRQEAQTLSRDHSAPAAPMSRTTLQILQAQDTKEGDDIIAAAGDGEEDECTGQEMRIHEIVSSLSSSNATPKVDLKLVEKKLKSSEGKGEGDNQSSTLSTVIVTTATSLVEQLLLDSSYQTPVKAKPSATSSSLAPLKAASAERKIEKDGEVVRFPSPLLFTNKEDDKLTLVSP
jgi:ankyrin repeat protein